MSGRRTRLFGRGTALSATDRHAAGTAPAEDAERPAMTATAPASPPAGGGAVLAGEAAALTIDALGRKCPIPIIMLAEQIRDVPRGAIVAVLADDPAAYTDIPSWCMLKAQDFAGSTELPGGGWALYIRRVL
jgi:tRNA 2-thiouridine synthesizing protein A